MACVGRVWQPARGNSQPIKELGGLWQHCGIRRRVPVNGAMTKQQCRPACQLLTMISGTLCSTDLVTVDVKIRLSVAAAAACVTDIAVG